MLWLRAWQSRWILCVLLHLCCSKAGAFEVAGEVVGGAEFVYSTIVLHESFLDERLTVEAGSALVSDLRVARVGAHAGIGIESEPLRVGVVVDWAPRQELRGWLGVAGMFGWRLERRGLTFDLELRTGLRNADVEGPRGVMPVGQLQIALDAQLGDERRWSIEAQAIAAVYDPELRGPALRGADAGLLVGVAGRPERWAARLHGSWRFHPQWRIEAGVGGLSFADGSGGAWLPRMAVRTGPWSWVSIETSFELLLKTDHSSDAPRWIAGLGVELARPHSRDGPASPEHNTRDGPAAGAAIVDHQQGTCSEKGPPPGGPTAKDVEGAD